MTTLHDNLKKHFGFDDFRAGQEEVITHLLAGHSTVAVFPTGAGKSLCYQLPALQLTGLTLVVSPLIALMKDQIDALHRLGIAAERLDLTLTAEEYLQIVDKIRQQQLRILYVSPERFNNERFRTLIQREKIALFVVDEAHCVSEWGHNFRPDYLKLPAFAKQYRAERVLALTATATESVLDDICTAFEIKKEHTVNTGFYRPNLHLDVINTWGLDRDVILLQKIKSRDKSSTIVYVTLQKTAMEIAAKLRAAGCNAQAYHAGMKDDQRSQIQEWFMSEHDGIVVATIAFGMGIDKANIRYVYHYNLPKSLENYAQEIGRAGRDGLISTCTMLVNTNDLSVLENFIHGDTPTLTAIETMLNTVFSMPEPFEISLHSLSKKSDIRILVIKTLLAYLELDGFLSEGTAFYASYQFRPLLPSAKILEKFDERRKLLISNVFKQATKGRTWFKLDIDQTSVVLNVPRTQIIKMLDYLHQNHMLEVQASGVLNRYRCLKRPENIHALSQILHERMLDREMRDLERLHEVLDLVQVDGCQVMMLAAHFNDHLTENCGHCSWCINQKPISISLKNATCVINDVLEKQLTTLLSEHEELSQDAESIVRVLCGITSPRITQLKLKNHSLFGIMESSPFNQVRIAVQQWANTFMNSNI